MDLDSAIISDKSLFVAAAKSLTLKKKKMLETQTNEALLIRVPIALHVYVFGESFLLYECIPSERVTFAIVSLSFLVIYNGHFERHTLPLIHSFKDHWEGGNSHSLVICLETRSLKFVVNNSQRDLQKQKIGENSSSCLVLSCLGLSGAVRAVASYLL